MPVPYVKKKPRARNRDGTWRKKRSDAGKKREKTMSEEIEKLQKAVKSQIDYILNPDEEKLDIPSTHLVIQTYTLLQILDTLDNIDEKLAMANINIQDVEQEVSKLNPRYTG